MLKSERNYLVEIFMGLMFVPLVMWLFPRAIPFSFFELWQPKGTVTDLFSFAWPILAWGAALSTLVSVFVSRTWEQKAYAERNLGFSYLLSAFAGFTEEVGFRWIIFMATIVSVKVTNFLFFGWLGFGLGEWLQVHFFGPVANFVTLGLLSEQLTNPVNWAVGAAVLSANAFFRDGHKYQGPIGLINSWFAGMFFFVLMFKFGLPAAILIHFIYDVIVFTVHYLDCVVERMLGRVRPRTRQYDY